MSRFMKWLLGHDPACENDQQKRTDTAVRKLSESNSRRERAAESACSSMALTKIVTEEMKIEVQRTTGSGEHKMVGEAPLA